MTIQLDNDAENEKTHDGDNDAAHNTKTRNAGR